MIRLQLPTATTVFVLLTLFGSTSRGEEILLWPADHEANGGTVAAGENEDREHIVVRQNPSIVPLIPPAGKRSGAGVVICPGGGYSILAFEKEGLEIGRWMNERGIAAFCLKYRCGGSPNGQRYCNNLWIEIPRISGGGLGFSFSVDEFGALNHVRQ